MFLHLDDHYGKQLVAFVVFDVLLYIAVNVRINYNFFVNKHPAFTNFQSIFKVYNIGNNYNNFSVFRCQCRRFVSASHTPLVSLPFSLQRFFLNFLKEAFSQTYFKYIYKLCKCNVVT